MPLQGAMPPMVDFVSLLLGVRQACADCVGVGIVPLAHAGTFGLPPPLASAATEVKTPLMSCAVRRPVTFPAAV